jgi:hypothetical protein
MADQFYLDEPALEGVTDSMIVAGTNLDTAWKKLDGVLTATQGCWGDDDIGKAFEGNYWEKADEVWTATEHAGEGINGTADYVRKKARYLEGLDERNARYIDSQLPQEE